MVVAGVGTWFLVQSQLSDERITVSDDAAHFAGDAVDGPLTAYSQAETIEKHATEASRGKTYAELAPDDPTRTTVMTRRSCGPHCSRRSSRSGWRRWQSASDRAASDRLGPAVARRSGPCGRRRDS